MSIDISGTYSALAAFLHGEQDYDQHDMARDAIKALDYWIAAYVRERQRVDLADTQAAGAVAACATLRAEVERLRVNAERYEWLRTKCSAGAWDDLQTPRLCGGFDAAIDAARGENDGR